MTALQKGLKNGDTALPLKRYLLLFANNSVRLLAQLGVIFLYSRSLPVNDYGQYQTVWLYVNVISALTLFGLPNVILTYAFADVTSWIKKSNRAIGAYVGTLGLMLLLFFFLPLVDFTWQTKTLLLFLIFSQNLAIITEYLAIKRSADNKVLVVNFIAAILFVASHIIALQIGYSLPLLLICMILIQILKFAVLVTFKAQAVSHPLRPDIGRQWLYIGLIDSLSVIYRWLDKWLILFFISVSQFAIYFNGSYEIPVFILMVSAIRNVHLVELSKRDVPDVNYVRPLFTQTTLLLAAIAFPAFSFFLFYHRDFFLLFFGQQYVEAIPIFLVSIFIIPLRITSFTSLLQAQHRNDLVLRGLVLDLALAVLFIVLLYPWLGIPGIALAFVLSSYLQVIYYLRKTIAITQLNLSDFFPLKQLCILLLLSVGVTAIFYFTITFYLPQHALFAGMFTSAMFSLVLLYIRRSKMLRHV